LEEAAKFAHWSKLLVLPAFELYRRCRHKLTQGASMRLWFELASPLFTKGVNVLNKKKQVIIITSVAVLTIISGVVFLKVTQADGTNFKSSNIIQAFEETPNTGEDGSSDNNDYTYIPPVPIEGNNEDEIISYESTQEEPFVPATEMDLDPTSITVFVNKEYALPKTYKPENLVTPDVLFNLITYDERTLMRPEAADALEKLFDAAERDGIILYGISGFRSYERQYKIFRNNIINKGKNYTLRYSAVPGTSEHQTGLAIDVSAKSLGFKLSSNFASSKEGIWLAKNAHNYGYIIRYPEDSEEITGYAFEPWHIRYVGKGLAVYLYENDMTLDEYYQYTPSPGFDFETLYAAMINYVPPVATGIPIDEDGIIVDENGNVIGEEIESDLPADEAGEVGTGDETETGEETLPDGDITGAPTDDTSEGNTDDAQVPDEDADTEEETDEQDNPEPNDETTTPSVTPSLSVTPTPTITPTPMAGLSNGDASATLPSDQNIVNE
jgi:D-alanyl-D-alanine carboxypeptidase